MPEPTGPKFELGDTDETEEIESKEDDLELPKEVLESFAKSAAKKERAKKELKKLDLDIVAEWLLDPDSAQKNSPEMLELFKKTLKEKDEDSSEEIDQMVELLGKMPEIFQQFDQEVEKLKGQDGYSEDKLQEKNLGIKKALLDGIINGHLKASEIIGMIHNVEIVPTKSNDPEEQKRIDAMFAGFGYSAPFFINVKEGKIYVTTDALKDVYTDPKTGMEVTFEPKHIKHMINHEISHAVTERGLVKNKVLADKSREIIADNGAKDTQSVHIKNTLEQNLPEERKIKEIIADYTAMFLKSDGSFFDFMAKCLDMTDIKSAQEQFGINDGDLDQLSQFADADASKKNETISALAEKSPAFYKLWETYGVFYQELSEYFGDKTRAKNEEPDAEGDEDEEWERDFGSFNSVGYSGGTFAEPATAAPKNAPKEESFIASALGLVKAMAGEMPGGGGSVPA